MWYENIFFIYLYLLYFALTCDALRLHTCHSNIIHNALYFHWNESVSTTAISHLIHRSRWHGNYLAAMERLQTRNNIHTYIYYYYFFFINILWYWNMIIVNMMDIYIYIEQNDCISVIACFLTFPLLALFFILLCVVCHWIFPWWWAENITTHHYYYAFTREHFTLYSLSLIYSWCVQCLCKSRVASAICLCSFNR